MRYAIVLAAALALFAADASAQESGNQIYQREAGNQSYNPRSVAQPSPLAGDLLLYDPKEFQAAPYVEAYVLMNVAPDAFVAVFALAQEAPTAAESDRKIDKLVSDLESAIRALGVRDEDMYVDFITQTPVYDYTASGRTVRESLTGVQTKKTLAVRYKDRAVLERMISAAANLGVYDLVKVDYVVDDMGPVRERLLEEAAKVVARKAASYSRLLGVALRAQSVSEERYAAYAPADLYRTYTAYEAGSVDASSSTRVVEQRKRSTSYYSPVTSASFDTVVNPARLEPTVQATLFLKVRCEWVRP
jgi:uncharacterized protein YggE